MSGQTTWRASWKHGVERVGMEEVRRKDQVWFCKSREWRAIQGDAAGHGCCVSVVEKSSVLVVLVV